MSATAMDRIRLPQETVLIVGAGLAGAYAALRLSPRPAVVIAPKGPGDAAASAWAQGGVAAALHPDDTAAAHAADTVAAGGGLVDPAMARLLAEEGPARVRHLAELGVPFDRNPDGAFALSLEAAHSAPRVARVTGDRAGAAVMAAVAQAARTCPSAELRRGLTAVALLERSDGRVGGVLARTDDGGRVAIEAGETVLALGGAGALYAVTTNPAHATGCALAMALNAGAAVRDPEFMQFHPTALDVGRDPAPLATEALRGDGASLIDTAGEPLLADPLSPRDVVARAVHAAREAGRGAFLDCRTAIGAAFPERFPTVFAAAQAAGLDPRTDSLPVAPAAHYHMGGVLTDAHARTMREGLWAVGECASTGVHGANRLASNSLLEALVFAERAARALQATSAPKPSPVGVPDAPPRLPDGARQRLRETMAAHAGVLRTADGLSEALTVISALEGVHGPANPLLAARAVLTAALAREESRGGHWRADHPSAHDTATHTRYDGLAQILPDADHAPPKAATA